MRLSLTGDGEGRGIDNNNTVQIARNDVYGRRYLLDVTVKF